MLASGCSPLWLQSELTTSPDAITDSGGMPTFGEQVAGVMAQVLPCRCTGMRRADPGDHGARSRGRKIKRRPIRLIEKLIWEVLLAQHTTI
jgi:hypothetical protein